jgi:hypothetical protein
MLGPREGRAVGTICGIGEETAVVFEVAVAGSSPQIPVKCSALPDSCDGDTAWFRR